MTTILLALLHLADAVGGTGICWAKGDSKLCCNHVPPSDVYAVCCMSTGGVVTECRVLACSAGPGCYHGSGAVQG
jgi:hypothetical protein